MVLSRPDIEKAISEGLIEFDPPIETSQIGQASIDLRLGNQFTRWKTGKTGVRLSVADGFSSIPEMWDTLVVAEKNELGQPCSFTLEPGGFVLAMTHESVSIPNNLIGHVEGRSTYARVGLSMHQTAPWIQPGWRGPIALEIRNSGTFSIDLTPIIDRPCQIVFFELSTALGSAHSYGSRPNESYMDQTHPLKHE